MQLDGEGTAEIVVNSFHYVFSAVGEYSDFVDLVKVNNKKKL